MQVAFELVAPGGRFSVADGSVLACRLSRLKLPMEESDG
jgi:hypothetical protein